MKYIIDLRIIIVCAGILSLFACNEDKGNYDYEAINRVTEIANIQESYSVEVGERLLITPELNTTSGNTDNLDYTWYYKSGSAWNVLQEGKDFDFVIADPIGSPNSTYTCAFEAKKQSDGYCLPTNFQYKSSGNFQQGICLIV